MYRIDNSTAAATLPTPAAAGTSGYFTDGVPGTTAATVVPADWLNAVQEELAYAITASGQTLNKFNRNQLAAALTGRLINLRVFNVAGVYSYTPTAGTNSVVVEVQGAGGGGGGAPATGAGQTSLGGNGGSGAYARKRLTTGFSGVTITVGAGGSGGTGTYGGIGNSSYFGSIAAAGGNGGVVVAATSATTYVAGSIAAATLPTSGDINIGGSTPAPNFCVAGNGISQAIAQSEFGASYGAGGYSSVPNTASQAAATGTGGQPGLVVVYEYS